MLDILVLLDRSGSMASVKSDHEQGLRTFVKDQQDLGLEGVKFTFIRFDGNNSCDVVIDRKPLEDVKLSEITLDPRGSTPLYVAMERSINHLKDQKPEKVIMMVVTDGGNTDPAGELSKPQLKALIKDLEEKEWIFLFLGADIDAFAEASQIGIGGFGTYTLHNAPSSLGNAYAAVSGTVLTASCGIADGANFGQMRSSTFNLSKEDRDDITGGTDSGMKKFYARKDNLKKQQKEKK